MVLAGMLNKHPCELRADFQRFYGLNLDGVGVDYTYAHAADLAVCLPKNANVHKAENATLEWSDAEYMLWSIEFSLRVLRWQNTKDGHSNRNKPKPLPTPSDYGRIRDKLEATDMKRIAEALGIDIEGGV